MGWVFIGGYIGGIVCGFLIGILAAIEGEKERRDG